MRGRFNNNAKHRRDAIIFIRDNLTYSHCGGIRERGGSGLFRYPQKIYSIFVMWDQSPSLAFFMMLKMLDPPEILMDFRSSQQPTSIIGELITLRKSVWYISTYTKNNKEQ